MSHPSPEPLAAQRALELALAERWRNPERARAALQPWAPEDGLGPLAPDAHDNSFWSCVLGAEQLRLQGRPKQALDQLERAWEPLRRTSERPVRVAAAVLRAHLADDLGSRALRTDTLATLPASLQVLHAGRGSGATALGFMARAFFQALHGEPGPAHGDATLMRWELDHVQTEPQAAAYGWEALATVAFRQGRHLEAASHYLAALQAQRRAGVAPRAVVSMLNIASSLSQLGHAGDVLRWSQAARRAVQSRGWPMLEGLVCLRVSSALRWQGRLDEAQAEAAQALRALAPIGPSRNLVLAWLADGEVAIRQADALRAEAAFGHADALASSLQLTDLRHEAALGLAQAAVLARRRPEAAQRLAAAEALARVDSSAARLVAVSAVRAWDALDAQDEPALQAALVEYRAHVRLAAQAPGYRPAPDIAAAMASLLERHPALAGTLGGAVDASASRPAVPADHGNEAWRALSHRLEAMLSSLARSDA